MSRSAAPPAAAGRPRRSPLRVAELWFGAGQRREEQRRRVGPHHLGDEDAADPRLLYFSDERHDLGQGEPLMLVECKRLIKDEKELRAAASQVRSYALWVLPAYDMITDAKMISVWDFQGAIAPDIEVLARSATWRSRAEKPGRWELSRLSLRTLA